MVNQALCGAVSQPLRHFNGIMDRHKHPEILDLLDFLGRGFIYQENNDPKHRSHDVLEWIQRHRITRHDWPNQSPILNIIESLSAIPKNFCLPKHRLHLLQNIFASQLLGKLL